MLSESMEDDETANMKKKNSNFKVNFKRKKEKFIKLTRM